VRSRLRAWRARSPRAARRLDAIADASPLVITGLTAAAGLAALLPQALLPAGIDRVWLVGATIGLATGIPFAADRRSLRRRIRDLPPAPDPLAVAPAPHDPHRDAALALAAGDAQLAISTLAGALAATEPADAGAHRLRALAAAATGDQRTARAYALRTWQLDPGRWDALSDTGLVLCRARHTREGCRLLQRAVDAAGGDARAEMALAQGLAMAGRLRDAVAALDRATGRTRAGLPRPS